MPLHQKHFISLSWQLDQTQFDLQATEGKDTWTLTSARTLIALLVLRMAMTTTSNLQRSTIEVHGYE